MVVSFEEKTALSFNIRNSAGKELIRIKSLGIWGIVSDMISMKAFALKAKEK